MQCLTQRLLPILAGAAMMYLLLSARVVQLLRGAEAAGSTPSPTESPLICTACPGPPCGVFVCKRPMRRLRRLPPRPGPFEQAYTRTVLVLQHAFKVPAAGRSAKAGSGRRLEISAHRYNERPGVNVA